MILTGRRARNAAEGKLPTKKGAVAAKCDTQASVSKRIGCGRQDPGAGHRKGLHAVAWR